MVTRNTTWYKARFQAHCYSTIVEFSLVYMSNYSTTKYMCWQNPCLSYVEVFCGDYKLKYCLWIFLSLNTNPHSLVMNLFLPACFLMPTFNPGWSSDTSHECSDTWLHSTSKPVLNPSPTHFHMLPVLPVMVDYTHTEGSFRLVTQVPPQPHVPLTSLLCKLCLNLTKPF